MNAIILLRVEVAEGATVAAQMATPLEATFVPLRLGATATCGLPKILATGSLRK